MSAALERAVSIDDLRRLAARRLPRGVFDFYDGGAEDEGTLRANRAAFDAVRLLPRVLNDVSAVDTAVPLLGAAARMPLAIAPTGAAGLAWPGADVAIARAAAAAGVPYTLSSAAHAGIEEIARAAPGRLWFQPYMLKQRDIVDRWIERARDADYEALVVTVDLPVGGKRERDPHNGFGLPFRFSTRNFWQFARRPAWSLGMLARGVPRMPNMAGLQQAPAGAAAMASTVGRSIDAAFDWQRLARLRDRWPRTLILKGLMRPDDAEHAVALGVDAIVVSNHGGRQLDGAAATLDALPGVVTAAAGRVPVLLDGGVRRGRHVVQALALGAAGVLVGRATLYGVAAGGEAGAARALDILRDEFERTLRLCGTGRALDVDGLLLA